MNHIELIEDLIKQAEHIEYENEEKDAVLRRAEMLLRRIYSDNAYFLTSLNKIRYSPSVLYPDMPDSSYIESFYSGKKGLLNLLNVILEDLKLDIQSDKADDKTKTASQISNKVFIVHGQNKEMKLAVARTIEQLELKPIILHEQASKGRTIIEKFEENSDVCFAIVILSADDKAYNKNEKPENAKFRARQNVIFELGFFIGKLGRERVVAIHENDIEIEILSDYSGVIHVPYDQNGSWKMIIVKELKAAGINVDANKIV